MPEILYTAILILSVGGTVALFRCGHYKALYHDARNAYDSVMDRAMEAERELGRLDEEHTTLKQTFTQALSLFQNRQSVAVMTDAQINQICQTMASLVAQQAGKSQLPN